MDPLSLKLQAVKHLEDLKAQQQTLEAQQVSTKKKLDDLLVKQDIIEKARVGIEQARPLLSAESVKQLESLANTALATIFEMQAEVSYDVESKRFILKDAEGNICDLADANGGGIVTVISLVFELFLLIKSGSRKILFYDEAWYAVSDAYYESFINFVRKACEDLGIDILCISHDARFTEDMANRVYRIEGGNSIRLK